MSDFDAIIIGGGPAGSSAAIHLAGRGARVLLAEQKRFPREKLCGEFISPECLEHFARLGVLERMTQADGAQKVVVGSARGITIFDDSGKSLATIADGTLRAFVIGNLFKTRKPHIVSLWSDKRSAMSRLAIHDLNGSAVSTYEQREALHCVAIGQPTARHSGKIVIAGAHTIALIEPRTAASGKPRWQGSIMPRGATIERIAIVDSDDGKARDISVSTTGGNTFVLDFNGKVVAHRTPRRAAEKVEFALAGVTSRDRE